MAKLTWFHEISERRNLGKEVVNQRMTVEVEYDPKENDFTIENVFVKQNGLPELEISRLLDHAEGNPLNAMIEAIDWEEIYRDSKQSGITEPEFNMADYANNLLKSIVQH